MWTFKKYLLHFSHTEFLLILLKNMEYPIFLLICMLAYFLLDGVYCKFHFVGCWMLLYIDIIELNEGAYLSYLKTV